MATQTPLGEYRLCQHLGFDTLARENRLALMCLTTADIPILHKIQQHAISPSCSLIVDRFYAYLHSFTQMRKFLGNDERLQLIKTSQTEYLLHFGLDFHTIDYFEFRLRIGIAHERIGMPLDLYLAAYRALQALIVEALPTKVNSESNEFTDCTHSIAKIAMLDISLAIEPLLVSVRSG